MSAPTTLIHRSLAAADGRREQTLALARELSGRNLIDGSTVEVASEQCIAVIAPASGEQIGHIPNDPAAAGSAAAAAERAFVPWSETAPLERSRLLLSAALSLENQVEEIAALISLETGRPISTETRPEAINAVRIARYFAALAPEIKGDTFPYTASVLVTTVREPLGPIAAITPWNVPAMLLCLKVFPALAAGNTVVVKPAEQASLSSLLIAEAIAAELPTGVLNLVGGLGESVGQALVSDPRVAKITFTGSVATGRLVAEQAAGRLIPVTLELGGKSPIVIFGDVEVDEAVRQTITGMRFSRQGQSCTSTTRILVHESIREPYLRELAAQVAAMRAGDPLDEESEIGTLVSAEQTDTVNGYLRLAAEEGLPVLTLNERPAAMRADTFVPATLVLDPPQHSRLVQEEIFGPVATVHSWETLEGVAALANGTSFGLSACILSDSIGSALTLARSLKAGFIQINSGMVIQPGLSFGGYKSSGMGREASLDAMLEAFTQVKTIVIDHEVRS
jgi:acyl-CoA reductase-like NAD-dependent aldehyde dehydrogenase